MAYKRTRRGKYNAKKVDYDGHTFDSKMECKRYMYLKQMLTVGLIKEIVLQPVFKFPCNVKYIADFKVTDNKGNVWYEDVKGFKTGVYRIKKKLLKYFEPDIDFREID